MPSIRDSFELAARFKAGDSSAEATIAAAFKVIDSRESKVGAFLQLDREGALAQGPGGGGLEQGAQALDEAQQGGLGGGAGQLQVQGPIHLGGLGQGGEQAQGALGAAGRDLHEEQELDPQRVGRAPHQGGGPGPR